MAATTQQYVSGQFAKGIKKKIADSNGTPQGKQKALSDELDAEIEQQITLFNEVNQAQQITAQSILVKKVKEAGSEKTAIAESIAATIAATIAGPPIAGALLTPRQKSILANIATLTVHKNLLNDLVIPEGNTVEKAQEALINLGELREQIAHNEEESKTLSGKFQEEINRQKSSLTSTAGTTINQAYVDHIQATIAILEAEQKKIPSFQTSETDIVKLSAEIKGKVILRKVLEKKLKDMQAQFPDRESKEEARYQNRINTPVNTAGLDAMTGPTAMASPTLDALKTLKANIDEVNKQREELAALEKIRPFIKNDKSTQSTQFQKECFAKLCELDRANAIVAHQLRDKAAGALIMSAMNEAEQQKLFSEQRLLDIAIRNRLKKEAITPEQKDEAKQSAKREASPASGHYSGSLTVEALGKEYGFSSLIKDPNTKEFKEQTLCGSDGKTPIKLDHETLMKLIAEFNAENYAAWKNPPNNGRGKPPKDVTFTLKNGKISTIHCLNDATKTLFLDKKMRPAFDAKQKADIDLGAATEKTDLIKQLEGTHKERAEALQKLAKDPTLLDRLKDDKIAKALNACLIKLTTDLPTTFTDKKLIEEGLAKLKGNLVALDTKLNSIVPPTAASAAEKKLLGDFIEKCDQAITTVAAATPSSASNADLAKIIASVDHLEGRLAAAEKIGAALLTEENKAAILDDLKTQKVALEAMAPAVPPAANALSADDETLRAQAVTRCDVALKNSLLIATDPALTEKVTAVNAQIAALNNTNPAPDDAAKAEIKTRLTELKADLAAMVPTAPATALLCPSEEKQRIDAIKACDEGLTKLASDKVINEIIDKVDLEVKSLSSPVPKIHPDSTSLIEATKTNLEGQKKELEGLLNNTNLSQEDKAKIQASLKKCDDTLNRPPIGGEANERLAEIGREIKMELEKVTAAAAAAAAATPLTGPQAQDIANGLTKLKAELEEMTGQTVTLSLSDEKQRLASIGKCTKGLEESLKLIPENPRLANTISSLTHAKTDLSNLNLTDDSAKNDIKKLLIELKEKLMGIPDPLNPSDTEKKKTALKECEKALADPKLKAVATLTGADVPLAENTFLATAAGQAEPTVSNEQSEKQKQAFIVQLKKAAHAKEDAKGKVEKLWKENPNMVNLLHQEDFSSKNGYKAVFTTQVGKLESADGDTKAMKCLKAAVSFLREKFNSLFSKSANKTGPKTSPESTSSFGMK